MAFVVAIVPAHNEQDTIRQTIHDLLKQTYKPDDVVVAADNCTDDTVGISGVSVSVFETENNNAFKSGALNQALRRLPDGLEYVLVIDADTRPAPNLIEEAIILLEANPNVGAVCARTHVLPMNNPSFFERIWLQLQKLEYATADSCRIEHLGKIQILAGSCVVYRCSALRQVAEMRGNDQFYDETSLIEDYEITLALKSLGWQVTLGSKMHSWTKVPTSFKVHWQQRIRWARSHVDTLWDKGWNKTTRKDIVSHIGFLALLAQQVFFLGLLGYLVLEGATIKWNPLLGSLLGIFWVNRMYRIKYVQDLSGVDILVRALYLPEELYGFLHVIQRGCAYYLAITKAPENWHIT